MRPGGPSPCLLALLLLSLHTASSTSAVCDAGQAAGRVRRAGVVLHGLTASVHPDSALVWVLDVYKGRSSVGESFGDRPLNVTRGRRGCWQSGAGAAQREVVVLGAAAEAGAGLLGAELLPWTPTLDHAVWRATGWSEWGEWAACSVSCGGGSQLRLRRCLTGAVPCEGSTIQRRQCNSFKCQGAVSLLTADRRRFVHGQWGRAPDRQSAWRLRPSSYLWLPSAELPPAARRLAKHFALMFSLRLDPKEPGGTVLSLRSRRQQHGYLSVEASAAAIRLVHAGPNGTQTVAIPTTLADGHWHQIAIGVHADSMVRSYVDCEWVSTDILRRDSLYIPSDADVVIGYLFSGDLEQLMMVPDPEAVSQQCSPAQNGRTDTIKEPKHRTESNNVLVYKTDNKLWSDDEDLEGSGTSAPEDQTELEQCHCLNGGSCHEGGCLCTDGFTGPYCQTLVCEPACLHGGRCVAPHKCSCPPATLGSYCQNFTCGDGCANGGVCVGPALCECPANATGPLCAQALCDPPCEHGATCAAGNTCLCRAHSSGTRCQIRNCIYRFVQEPYTRGFRKLAKKHSEVKCKDGLKSCLKAKAEYQTVYKTFYRTVYKCDEGKR